MDELKSLIVKILLLALTALATKLHLDPTATSMFPALAADAADLVVMAYGIYSHRGMVKVSADALAQIPASVKLDAGIIKAHPAAVALAIIASLAFAACSPTQISSYTMAVKATDSLIRTIAGQVVAFDCKNSALIQIIAKDLNAASKVQAAVAANAQLALDVCPAIIGAPPPAISVVVPPSA